MNEWIKENENSWRWDLIKENGNFKWMNRLMDRLKKNENCWIDWLIKENEWSHFEAVVVEEELAFAGENEEFGLDLFFEAGLALVVEDTHAFLE